MRKNNNLPTIPEKSQLSDEEMKVEKTTRRMLGRGLGDRQNAVNLDEDKLPSAKVPKTALHATEASKIAKGVSEVNHS
jgi:hypothetical protein